jgi:putative endonuclease
MSGTLTRLALHALDSFARLLPRKDSGPQHLHTGRRGEEAAYFHLRKHGYVIIARNYRSPRSRSELDLVGWDGETLCFIEVKTRTTRNIMPAEAAVDAEKQRDLSHVAREFLRKVKKDAPFRFDIVSVYFEPGLAPDIELFRNAFVIAKPALPSPTGSADLSPIAGQYFGWQNPPSESSGYTPERSRE